MNTRSFLSDLDHTNIIRQKEHVFYSFLKSLQLKWCSVLQNNLPKYFEMWYDINVV